MGWDVLNDLKVKLDFKSKVISWEDEDLYMKDESEAIRNATERTTKILDSKYEKADLRKIVDQEC
eukprot:15093126-Ditylum_brightwellii.AAC.1